MFVESNKYFNSSHRLINEMNGSLDSTNEDPVKQFPKLLVWSALEKRAAERMTSSFHKYIEQSPQAEIENMAYALTTRRSHFPWRSFKVVNPCNSLGAEKMKPKNLVRAQNDSNIAFIFTGQGSQYPGMGCELLKFAVFRNSIELLEDCLKQLGCPWSLSQVLTQGVSNIYIDRPEYSQPLITCLEIALVDLLASLGVVPAVVLGHSSGEIAAAYATGGLSRLSAVKAAYYRGLLSSQLADKKTGFSMMAVGISKENLEPYLNRLRESDGTLDVSIGCINSPNSLTLTGKSQQLDALYRILKKDSLLARRLPVPISYHSSVMNEISEDYRLAMGDLEAGRITGFIPMISSVTGDIVIAETVRNADYWVQNLTSRVEFQAALSRLLMTSRTKPRKQLGKALLHLGVSHLLEIGPHNTLEGPVNETLRAVQSIKKPIYIPLLTRKMDAYSALLNAAGNLYCAGIPVDLLSINSIDEPHRPTPPNMPKYPFNHKQTYWKEGRLSKNFRFRNIPRHDLLGVRSLDWNPQVAQWRNVIRLSELPWLQDHKIEDQVVFPAAGMVVIAVEAFRQLLSGTEDLTGIQLNDVNFLHPIRFTEGSEQVETQLNLFSEWQSLSGLGWSQFRLFVMDKGSYIECCRGMIRGNLNQNVPLPNVSFTNNNDLQRWITEVSDACQVSSDPYSMSTGSAVEYGPCFQNVEKLRLGTEGKAISNVSTSSWKSKNVNDEWAQQYAIHPCTMDGLAQLVVCALAQGLDYLPTMVPVRVSNMWLNYQELSCLEEGTIQATAKCGFRGHRGATANIVGTITEARKPVIYFERLETTFIGSMANPGSKMMQPRELCTRIAWKPDVAMMSEDQLLLEVTRHRPKEPVNIASQWEKLNLAILCFITKAFEYVESSSSLSVPEYFQAYIAWMKYQQRLHPDAVLQETIQNVLAKKETFDELIAKVGNSGVEGFFFMHVGQSLISVLAGETDPLDLMFRNDLAERYYEQMLGNVHHSYPATMYIENLCFKYPSMNILEIGAGTGGQTLRSLEALASGGVMKCARYDYTDISPGFFPRARERLAKYEEIMGFRVCDISKDPVSQSFKPGSYDLVLASHVLHATNNLHDSLCNIHKLLKPGGKLLLFETTNPDALHIGFAFGLLKGWWNHLDNDSRSPHSPCLTTAQWGDRLKESGFSGIDVEFPGQETVDCRTSSIIISTAVAGDVAVADFPDDIILFRNPTSSCQSQLADAIRSRLPVSIHSLEDAPGISFNPRTMVVFLMEVQETLLDGISESRYLLLQSVLTKAKNILWITQSSTGQDIPQHHLAEGLGRTLASEDSTTKFVTLSLEGLESEKTINIVIELIRKINHSTMDTLEANYMAKQGILCIPRVTKNSPMNDRNQKAIMPRENRELEYHSSIQACLHIATPGSISSLEYREGEPELLPILEDELLVRVRAFGLTFQDYLAVTGQIDRTELGTECAGIVLEAGINSGFQPGDRVCLIGNNLACNIVRTRAQNAALIPPEMTFAEAASLPTSLWLAYHCLCYMARLESGDVVLIYQGASSFGQMAIQVASKKGARVLTTTSSASQENFISKELGIAGTDVFLANDPLICNKVYQATGGNGVDIVIGALTDKGCPDFTECLAVHGRLIDITMKEFTNSAVSLLSKRVTNTSRSSIDMAEIFSRKPGVAQKSFQEAMKLLFEKNLQAPGPMYKFAAGDIQAAFSHYHKTRLAGKRVIEMSEESMINVCLQRTEIWRHDTMLTLGTLQVNCISKPKYEFPSNASYIIAGGLGGLGRSFARWMASRGARYLILLSRSGPQTSAAYDLLEELKQKGVTVATPMVDISDLCTLKETLANIAQTMPPLRGCIQATVALRVGLLALYLQ
jgi:acyl transferase domain-containing protein/NADPH:quinone reductase-like Zn-dependent oxidoreductase/ubiquinone/menaquinone biosynthesis C-methylase UbiE